MLSSVLSSLCTLTHLIPTFTCEESIVLIILHYVGKFIGPQRPRNSCEQEALNMVQDKTTFVLLER